MNGEHGLTRGGERADSLDTESLLSQEHRSEKQLLQPLVLTTRAKRNRRIKIWLHAAALVFYSVLTIVLYTWSLRLRTVHGSDRVSRCEIGMISSPAQEAVEYEQRVITHNLDDPNSKYRGAPSPAVDAAWDELLQYNNLRAYEDELRAANMTSVPLRDDKGGYLVTLDVYHTLHCVNRARKALYPAYYTSPNRPEVDRAHVEHCLDLLRRVLMCHGDVALHTYQWLEDRAAPWPTFQTTHQCRKWERIVEWSKGRNTGSLLGPILQHPTLGISYSDEGQHL